MTFYRAIVSGNLGEGEQYQWGVGINDTGLSTTQDVADDFASAIAATPDQLQNLLKTNDTIQLVTVYRYPVIGGPASEVAEASPGPLNGAQTGSALPPQCALVVSTRTGLPGRSRRGRMYLPLHSPASLTESGRISSTLAANLASDLAIIFSAFNNSLSGRRVAVLSTVKQEAYNITGIDVGDVVDTQRRRRNDLTEVRYSESVSAL